ncbi:MAG: DUF362 domain-containing protein [Lachnospiraceae bacterium]|nr:DUF362 domain-containing protein [Lachnospiraceae bacterium]
MKSYVCLNQKKTTSYPQKDTLFRPHKKYPEYMYEEISGQNDIYDMVRESMYMLGLDKENYDTVMWNPLKEIIIPGDTVLIKPNMVLHNNTSLCGEDCLYTNPSLVATMIEYTWLALRGRGKIVVGDAPLQECDFETLITQSGYKEMIDYYISKGVNIELVDFRNVKTYEKYGLHYMQSEELKNGVIVGLDEYSVFSGLSQERINNLRITNYDPRILQEHHSKTKHEYNVSKYVLDADVIINMPKPKTHRKAGVTIALKNLIGINANKEYLPHHTLGSVEEGGDSYSTKNNYLKMANDVLDMRNELMHDGDMELAAIAVKFYESLLNKGVEQGNEKYWEGSWYGNDTIWRTITDLNRILLYADKNGVIQKKQQRKLFIVGDMIVSGQKEGPLEPVPIYPGVIAMGNDALIFDRVVCSIMGFDYQKIPSLCAKEIVDSDFSISNSDEYEIVSNNLEWNGRSYEYIVQNSSLKFEPTMGWIDRIGNKYRDDLIGFLHNNKNKNVYIFGTGTNGIYAYRELMKYGITVTGFFDNDSRIWNKIVIDDVKCYDPSLINENSAVVVAARDRYLSELKKQIKNKKGLYVGTINRGY